MDFALLTRVLSPPPPQRRSLAHPGPDSQVLIAVAHAPQSWTQSTHSAGDGRGAGSPGFPVLRPTNYPSACGCLPGWLAGPHCRSPVRVGGGGGPPAAFLSGAPPPPPPQSESLPLPSLLSFRFDVSANVAPVSPVALHPLPLCLPSLRLQPICVLYIVAHIVRSAPTFAVPHVRGS